MNEDLIEIRIAADQIGVCWETLTNWIAQEKIERIPKYTAKRGANVLCIRKKDLAFIVKKKADPYKDYVTFKDLAEELDVSVSRLTSEAINNEIETVKKKSGNVKGSRISAVSTENAEKIRNLINPNRSLGRKREKHRPTIYPKIEI